MAEETNEEELGIVPLNAPTSYTNEVVTDVSKDRSIILIHLISDLPSIKIENHRTVLSEYAAITLINELAEYLDHYPKKPRKKTAAKKKTSKAKK